MSRMRRTAGRRSIALMLRGSSVSRWRKEVSPVAEESIPLRVIAESIGRRFEGFPHSAVRICGQSAIEQTDPGAARMGSSEPESS
jgi:hypothetical protein